MVKSLFVYRLRMKLNQKLNHILNITRNQNFPLAVALPKQSFKIIKLLKKLFALELIQKNDETIKIDKIARKSSYFN